MPVNLNPQWFVVLVLVGLLIAFVACGCKKQKITTKENYEDIFYAKDYAKDSWVSRPTFRADLDPRFDANRYAGTVQGSFPGMAVQAAPVTPVEGLVSVQQQPSYATMGGSGNDGAYADPRMPSGGLTTSQVNNILAEKFGRSGYQQNYVAPKELLPVADMKKALARDPSDPNTFMYDRYLFAPLKRRYGNVQVDFIRGDLAIPQLRMGWFDVNPVAAQDLAQGYFADYLDVQQSQSIRDSLWERKPTMSEEESSWGRLGQKTVYSVL